jgi:ABC-type transporter Mla subunit MlaD
MMGARGPYVRVGALILAGVALAVGLIWFLGGASFSHGRVLETYFSESVQGLEVGAPVKYRGVTLGRVTDIGLVNAEYHSNLATSVNDQIYRLVFVRYAIDPTKLGPAPDTATAVRLGLRARLAAQGITGLSYIELDFVDPRLNPVPPVPWQPKGDYVPSVPSTLGQLQDAAQNMLSRLAKVDFDGLATSATELMQDLHREVTTGDAHQALTQLAALLQTLRETVTAADLPGLSADIRHTSGAVRNVAQSEDLRRLLSRAAAAADGLARVTASLPPLIAALQATTQRANAGTADVQQALVPLLRDLQLTAENLREATDALRRYPAQMLLSQPPPRTAEPVR